jgi:hypothetical protein
MMKLAPPDDVAACNQLGRAIMRLIDASDAPPMAKANAVLAALARVVADNAVARGADPMDDAAKWAKHLRLSVELNLRFPNGLP